MKSSCYGLLCHGQGVRSSCRTCEYSSTSDLNEKLSGLAPHADAVSHAAVSDFRVKRVFQRVEGQEVELKDGENSDV